MTPIQLSRAFYFFYFSAAAALSPFLALYYERIGLSGSQIGVLRGISPLIMLTNLQGIDLGYNQISDVWPLANLTNLTYVDLKGNQIRNISPLIHNEGLGAEDMLDLQQNPLSADSVNISIPQLQAKGVIVYY